MDPVQEGMHATECGGVQGQQICPIGKYREEESVGDTMAWKESNTSPVG